jgi:hypothetical protein
MLISPKDRKNIFGSTVVTHRGKTLIDIGSSTSYRDFVSRLDETSSKLAEVPNNMEGRPDLLSYAAYGSPNYWWLIVEANEVYDYEVDLKAGTVIKIPQI